MAFGVFFRMLYLEGEEYWKFGRSACVWKQVKHMHTECWNIRKCAEMGERDENNINKRKYKDV